MKGLSINISKFNQEQLDKLDQLLIENEFEGISYDIDYETKVLVFYKDKLTNEVLTFHSYIEQGKLIKYFLLTNGIITDTTDNSLFSLIELNVKKEDTIMKSVEEMDKMFYKVTDKDPKMAEVLEQLKKLKK